MGATFGQLWDKSMGSVTVDLDTYHHQEVQDLEDLAKNFYNNMCRQAGRKDGCYKYVDLKGQQDKNWPGRRVNIEEVQGLQYTVIDTIAKPSLVLSQDYCNSLSLNTAFLFRKRTETSATAEWEFTDTISWGQSITASVGIPAFGGIKFTESLNMSWSTTEKQSTTHSDIWEIDTMVPVPALTFVNATFTVVETDYAATFTADVIFNGCVNVWFQDKINDHWEWWYPVTQVFGSYPGFTCWTTEDLGKEYGHNEWCKYTSKGKYQGIGGASSHMDTDHHDCIKSPQELISH